MSAEFDKRKNKLFLILGSFFLTNAIVAEFIGAKIFSLEATLGLNPANITLFGETKSFNNIKAKLF